MGAFEILIVLIVLTLVVGPRRLIGLGQSIGEALGRGTKEFMGKIDGNNKTDDKEIPGDKDDREEK